MSSISRHGWGLEFWVTISFIPAQIWFGSCQRLSITVDVVDFLRSIRRDYKYIYIYTNMKVIRTSVRESLFQSQVIKLLGRDMEERYEAISAAESVIEESMTHLGQKKKLESCLTNKEGAWRDNERQEQPDHQSPEDSQISAEAWTDFERTRRPKAWTLQIAGMNWYMATYRWTPYWRCTGLGSDRTSQAFSDSPCHCGGLEQALHWLWAGQDAVGDPKVRRCTKGAKWKGAASGRGSMGKVQEDLQRHKNSQNSDACFARTSTLKRWELENWGSVENGVLR